MRLWRCCVRRCKASRNRPSTPSCRLLCTRAWKRSRKSKPRDSPRHREMRNPARERFQHTRNAPGSPRILLGISVVHHVHPRLGLRPALPLDRGRFLPHPIYGQREGPHESTRRANCTRRLLRDTLLHRQGPGKIEGLLCPNSWREGDQAGKSVLHQLANTWIILNSGGGPTPDKPEVLLETPADLNRVNSFLNLRVADIWTCYKQ